MDMMDHELKKALINDPKLYRQWSIDKLFIIEKKVIEHSKLMFAIKIFAPILVLVVLGMLFHMAGIKS